jgi:hypothetical protein
MELRGEAIIHAIMVARKSSAVSLPPASEASHGLELIVAFNDFYRGSEYGRSEEILVSEDRILSVKHSKRISRETEQWAMFGTDIDNDGVNQS